MSDHATADFRTVGAQQFPAVLSRHEIERVAALFGSGDRPGKRLSKVDIEPIADLIASSGAIGRIADQLLGDGAKPVRGLLLDKSEAANWRLGWHQDRTIAVHDRVDLGGYGPWSIKAGQIHVQPPHEITERMVTLRVHIDSIDEQNAPLEVLPGSHLIGRLSNEAVEILAGKLRPLTCLADAGDVWAYSTAIVHCSSEQRRRGRRRVLQLDYSADDLPNGLKWTVWCD